MILITSSGEFSCIYIFFSVFSVFNFVSFFFVFSQLYPFLVELFFSLFGVCFVFVVGVSSSGLEIVNQG